MLSSILQQQGDIPNIDVSISYTKGNGNPTTEDVIDYFSKKGLNIIPVLLDKKEVHNRSIPRNIRAKKTQADWILYADSDMVYDPLFFSDLKSQLNTTLKDEKKVMGANRVSLQDKFCINYFENLDFSEYPKEIENVSDIVSKWPVKWIKGKNVAPGNFQLANVGAIKEKGGVYTHSSRDVWRSTRSDRGFRVQMGGRVGINTKPQYHLNHDRLGPEIQR
jgi:hypothetical protein